MSSLNYRQLLTKEPITLCNKREGPWHMEVIILLPNAGIEEIGEQVQF